MRHGLLLPLLATLLLLTFGLGSVNAASDCCVGYRGNLDGDPYDEVSLGDLVALLDVMFGSLEPPACWEEANLDQSQPEGPGSVSLSDLTVMIDVLFISLAPPPDCPHSSEPQGEVIDHSSCKSKDGYADKGGAEGCLHWMYDGDGVLTIEHINTVLNCCPVILAEVEVSGDPIVITQIDSLFNGGCDCACVFDITYEITNLSPGAYTITVVEPYLFNQGPEMVTTVDLVAEPEGTFCLPRSGYPWDE